MSRVAPEDKMECSLFHDLVHRFKRGYLEEIYVAIQAAIYFKARFVDVSDACNQIMTSEHTAIGKQALPIGPQGLAFFCFLFQVSLVEKGLSDYHTYRFTNRYSGASVLSRLKTDLHPDRADFQKSFDAMLKKLDKARDAIIDKSDWKSAPKTLSELFPEGTTIFLEE
jgi:hypothetical protein